MKKVLLFFCFFIVVSCQNSVMQEGKVGDADGNVISENIGPEKVSFCYSDAEIATGFSRFFSGDHCTNDGDGPAGLVVFLDENNQKIENFENISENSSAHIFGLKKCENGEFLTEEERGKVRHLIGKCSEGKCEFEEDIEKPWVVLLPFDVKQNILILPKTGYIPEIVAGGQDCTDGL